MKSKYNLTMSSKMPCGKKPLMMHKMTNPDIQCHWNCHIHLGFTGTCNSPDGERVPRQTTCARTAASIHTRLERRRGPHPQVGRNDALMDRASVRLRDEDCRRLGVGSRWDVRRADGRTRFETRPIQLLDAHGCGGGLVDPLHHSCICKRLGLRAERVPDRPNKRETVESTEDPTPPRNFHHHYILSPLQPALWASGRAIPL